MKKIAAEAVPARGRGRGRSAAPATQSPVAPTEARRRARAHLGTGPKADNAPGSKQGEGDAGPKVTGGGDTAATTQRTGRGSGASKATGAQQGTKDQTGTGTGAASAAPAVAIEKMVVPGRGGRQMSAEKYPFGQLSPVKKEKDGSLVGDTFLIPSADSPDNHLAAARKRHGPKGVTFISRKVPEGIRVWREK